MRYEWARGGARWVAGAVMTVLVCWLPAGAAHADETNRQAHNGPRIGLVNTGQVDDPMEDVLEHVLLIGDGFVWD
ncbi:membrane protein [Streptomyces thermocarboxydovorans]|uniref:Membrane protein n=1 Tax=Streptomyces thermocarboxydovorans TaxID=59298 RepID=A0ABN1HE78_9ACTN